MKRLIITIATLGTGGAERVLSILSKSLADHFDDVHLVMWDGGETFYRIDDRIKIVSLPQLSGKKGRIKQVKTYRQYIKKENPDLILSFLTPYNMLVLFSTLYLRKKVVVAERTDPKRKLAGGKPMLFLRDILYKKAYGILTQTVYAKECYGEKFADKTKVIYNPIMMDEDYVGKALRSEKDKTIVAVGRLEAIKDQETMIDAFELFHKTHKDYRLVIYGEGPLRSKLEGVIAGKGLQKSIILAGRNNDVWVKMITADCFLLTSLAEGMSNAMIEAMCLGLPVISTKVAGATDFIQDGKNGYLVDIRDANTIACRIAQIVDTPELPQQIGSEAIKVYELLKADKICKEWIDYLSYVEQK